MRFSAAALALLFLAPLMSLEGATRAWKKDSRVFSISAVDASLLHIAGDGNLNPSKYNSYVMMSYSDFKLDYLGEDEQLSNVPKNVFNDGNGKTRVFTKEVVARPIDMTLVKMADNFDKYRGFLTVTEAEVRAANWRDTAITAKKVLLKSDSTSSVFVNEPMIVGFVLPILVDRSDSSKDYELLEKIAVKMSRPSNGSAKEYGGGGQLPNASVYLAGSQGGQNAIGMDLSVDCYISDFINPSLNDPPVPVLFRKCDSLASDTSKGQIASYDVKICRGDKLWGCKDGRMPDLSSDNDRPAASKQEYGWSRRKAVFVVSADRIFLGKPGSGFAPSPTPDDLVAGAYSFTADLTWIVAAT